MTAPTIPSRYLKGGHLKKTYIDCAVDESLARSIWDVIDKNKTGRRLERLKLWTNGVGVYGGSGRGTSSWVMDVLDNLSRSWLIERVPRIDHDEITVWELGRYERKARDARIRHRHEAKHQEIFDEVWPSKQGSESWQDDWSSFPLQV